VRLFFAILSAIVLIYLVVDFADRAHTYTGRAWGRAAAELYANKAAVVAYQLAPAALIIAAALVITLLSRRGELTALFSLGVRPLRLTAPISAFAAVLGLALFWLGEKVVVRADARAEEIQVKRFNRWGDWATYHAGSSWLRGKGNRIFHLGPQRDGGWEPATVLEIAPPFRLSRRIDARRIEPADGRAGCGGNRPGAEPSAAGCRWRLLDAVETRYELYGGPGGVITERRLEDLVEWFPESPSDLELRSGRPRQLPLRLLREQVRRRENAGQQAREYEVALAERVAAPLQTIPAALAAAGLAFSLRRPRRRMPVAGAVALGMGLSVVLWAASVIAHAVSLSGGVDPWIGAAIPGLLSLAISAIALRRA
jgi:lipopolysaccharide export system permease protein